MSVSIAQRIVAGLRAAGVAVIESDGCYSRGNGQVSDYQGLVVHHTASPFGRDYKTLYTGRPDLSGPLCNSSGNDDGSITIIAAHPANHAGASGGWDTAPLPRTTSFNKLVWGHEVVYPGVEPMRPAQYKSALILARVVCDVLGKPLSHVKFHNGTSVTGKWDPGYANGKTYDVAKFRLDAAALSLTPTKKKGPYDMAGILWKSPKGQLAYQDGPLFIGIDQATADQLFGQGIIQIKPNQVTWDALAAGLATGQSDADEAAAANPPAPPIE